MSIRAKLAAAMAALCMLIAAHSVEHVLDDFAVLANAERGNNLSEAAHHIYNASGRYALERGLTNILLRDPALGTPELRQALETSRANADDSLTRGIAAAEEEVAEPHVREAIEAIATARADVARWRGEVDQALASGTRAPERLIEFWFPAMNDFVADLQPLRGILESRMVLDEPAMVSGLLAMRATLEAAEFLGRERTMLAGVLADRRPMTEQERTELWQGRGRITSAWAIANGHSVNLGSAYMAAAERSNRAIFEEFEAERRETLRQIESGAPAVTADEWFRISTNAIESLREMRLTAAERITEANAQRYAQAQQALALSIAVILLLLSSDGVFYWFVTRSVTRPLEAIAETIGGLERKDFSDRLGTLPQQSDEVGRLASAVIHLRDTIRENETLVQQQQALRAQAETRQREAIDFMSNAVDKEAGIVAEDIASRGMEIARRADHLALMMAHMSDHAKSVADAAASALATVDSAASTAEKISADIAAIGAQASEASASTREAVEAGQDARTRIASLEHAVGQIGEVAEMIGTVAQKTNMLALNATIEAARAGAAGKGFAVVATEVKSLAGQTAQATEEVARLVHAVRNAMHEVTTSVGEIEGRIAGIDQIAERIAQAVQEQTSSTQKIAADIAETATAARDVTEHIANVSDQTDDGRRLARDVRSIFSVMHERVDQLQHTLSRLVRNAAADAERRVSARFATQQDIILVSLHGQHRGRAIDLSLGGARVEIGGALPNGSIVKLRIPAWDLEVPAEIVGTAGQALRMKFTGSASDATHAKLAERLSALGKTAKAA
jgi:methyl-accepting chemotaxis protein